MCLIQHILWRIFCTVPIENIFSKETPKTIKNWHTSDRQGLRGTLGHGLKSCQLRWHWFSPIKLWGFFLLTKNWNSTCFHPRITSHSFGIHTNSGCELLITQCDNCLVFIVIQKWHKDYLRKNGGYCCHSIKVIIKSDF